MGRRKALATRLDASEKNPFSRENLCKMYIDGGYDPKKLVDVAMIALSEIKDPKLRVDAACNLHKSFGAFVTEAPRQQTDHVLKIVVSDPRLLEKLAKPKSNIIEAKATKIL